MGVREYLKQVTDAPLQAGWFDTALPVAFLPAFQHDCDLRDNCLRAAGLAASASAAGLAHLFVNGHYADRDGARVDEVFVFVRGRCDETLRGLVVRWIVERGLGSALYKPHNSTQALLLLPDKDGRDVGELSVDLVGDHLVSRGGGMPGSFILGHAFHQQNLSAWTRSATAGDASNPSQWTKNR